MAMSDIERGELNERKKIMSYLKKEARSAYWSDDQKGAILDMARDIYKMRHGNIFERASHKMMSAKHEREG